MKTVKLGDICLKITDGSHNPPKATKDGEFMMLSSRNIQDDEISFDNIRLLSKENFDQENKRTDVQPGDVLLTIVGTIGRTIVVPESLPKFTLQRSVAVIKPDTAILDPYYLVFHLRSNVKFLIDNARGVAQKGIYLNQIKELEVELPSLEEQQQIVARLDAAFEKIAQAEVLMRRNLDNVVALQKSILHKYLSASDSTHTHRLGAICNFVRGPFGGTLKKEYFKPEGYAVYEQRHAIYGMETPVRYFIDEKKFDEMKRFEIKPDDLIMSCSGTLGKISIIPNGAKQGVINQALLKFTPKKDVINAKYLKYLVESRGFQEAIRERSGGSAIQNVASVKILKEIDVALPPIAIQERVVQQIEDANKTSASLQEKYSRKLSMLEVLRNSMLREVFSTTNAV